MDVRETLIDLIIDAKRTDPETGRFTEYLADYLISHGVTVQERISVKDRLPEEHESLFARYKGTDKWLNAMFMTISDPVIVCAEYENGKRIVKTANTVDGVWKVKNIFHPCKVTHWMPFPNPPEEPANDNI